MPGLSFPGDGFNAPPNKPASQPYMKIIGYRVESVNSRRKKKRKETGPVDKTQIRPGAACHPRLELTGTNERK